MVHSQSMKHLDIIPKVLFRRQLDFLCIAWRCFGSYPRRELAKLLHRDLNISFFLFLIMSTLFLLVPSKYVENKIFPLEGSDSNWSIFIYVSSLSYTCSFIAWKHSLCNHDLSIFDCLLWILFPPPNYFAHLANVWNDKPFSSPTVWIPPFQAFLPLLILYWVLQIAQLIFCCYSHQLSCN